MTTRSELINLRLQLAIRKAMLTIADRRIYKNVLATRFFTWARREEIAQVIEEYVREGIFTEEKGKQGGIMLTWHEEKLQ